MRPIELTIHLCNIEPAPDELIQEMKRTAPEGVALVAEKITALSADGGGWTTLVISWVGGPISVVALNLVSAWIYEKGKEYLARRPPQKTQGIRIEERPLKAIDSEGLRQLLRAKVAGHPKTESEDAKADEDLE